MEKIKQITLSFCLITFFMLLNFSSFSQDEGSKTQLNFSSDFMSRYVWRGLQLGGAYPSIQPKMELSKANFSLGAWGAFSTNALQNQEIDIYASYTFAKEMFTFTITDYFFPSDTAAYNYFVYDKDATAHLFEASLKFNGTDKIPFTLLLATNFYGADTKKLNGNNTLSTYVELGYECKIKEVKLNSFIGSAVNAPGDNITGFYGNTKTGIINLGVTAYKDIQITDKFALPLSSSLILNPYAKSIFFVFGFTL